MSSTRRIHFRTCTLCEAMCGLRLTLEDERVVDLRGDPLDPGSQGHICPKAWALVDLQDDPDRIARPLRRKGRDFEQVPWDEALDEAAERLDALRVAHGPNSRAIYLGNPTIHNLGAMAFGPALMRALGTQNRFSATSVDQLPHMVVAQQMWGHPLLLPVPDLDRTDLLVIMGANPAVSAGSLMGAPGFPKRMRALRERGGCLWVFDPRRSETARLADVHHFVKPGSDGWLLLAILRRLIARGAQPPRMGLPVDGLTTLQAALAELADFDLFARTGVPQSVADEVADALRDTPKAALYGRMGLSTQRFGTLCQWLINLINLFAGQLDREGGVLFSAPAVETRDAPRGMGVSRAGFGRFTSRVRGLPAFGGELPVACLAEEILTPGDGQVRGLVTFAGNPVLSTPNGRRLDEALASLDFMLSIDLYLNETTRHAHLILPPAPPLARSHYDLALHLLATRDTAKYSPPCFDKDAGAKDDWQILSGLARRLLRRSGAPRSVRATAAALHALGPEGILGLGLRLGPHGVRAWPPRRGLSLAKLRERPHGVDLGPRRAGTLPERVPKGTHLNLAPERLLADLKRLASEARSSAEDGAQSLALIGRRQLRSNNSWLHNSERLMRGGDRCSVMVHPDDATRLGLTHGGRAEIRTEVGAVIALVEVTAEMMPGVVSLPHGFGHDRDGARLRVASRAPGVSLNDLSSELRLDEASGNAAFSGQPVQLRPSD